MGGSHVAIAPYGTTYDAGTNVYYILDGNTSKSSYFRWNTAGGGFILYFPDPTNLQVIEYDASGYGQNNIPACKVSVDGGTYTSVDTSVNASAYTVLIYPQTNKYYKYWMFYLTKTANWWVMYGDMLITGTYIDSNHSGVPAVNQWASPAASQYYIKY